MEKAKERTKKITGPHGRKFGPSKHPRGDPEKEDLAKVAKQAIVELHNYENGVRMDSRSPSTEQNCRISGKPEAWDTQNHDASELEPSQSLAELENNTRH